MIVEMNWERRVVDCQGNVDALVELHRDRLNRWDDYIKLLTDKGYKEVGRDKRKVEDMKDVKVENADFLKKLINPGQGVNSPWAKIRLEKGEVYVLMDAGFGSLDPTSDLDVNVVSTNDEVLKLWMQFTTDIVKEKSIASFCEYYDSNFYYEPGTTRPIESNGKKSKEVVPWTKTLMTKKFEWTTASTALYELSCVKTYCDAYESYQDIVVEGKVSSPRPVGMTLDREQACYRTSLHFAEEFRKACEKYDYSGADIDADTVRYAYLKYAVTKIEALVSVTSLAVCKVFGKDVFDIYKEKQAKYLTPYVSGISAYEMLRNLKMHSHDNKYKSKYANRLRYALFNTEGLCNQCSRAQRFDMDNDKIVKVDEVAKTNSAELRSMTQPIAVILDFMDGKDTYDDGPCPYVKMANGNPDKNKWLKNLKGTLAELCDRAYDYVEGLIKEETSKKKQGTKYVDTLISP